MNAVAFTTSCISSTIWSTDPMKMEGISNTRSQRGHPTRARARALGRRPAISVMN